VMYIFGVVSGDMAIANPVFMGGSHEQNSKPPGVLKIIFQDEG